MAVRFSLFLVEMHLKKKSSDVGCPNIQTCLLRHWGSKFLTLLRGIRDVFGSLGRSQSKPPVWIL